MNEIIISVINVKDIDLKSERIPELLPPSRMQSVDRLSNEKAARLSVGAHLAFLALKNDIGAHADYFYEKSGKPRLTDADGSISFAHSHDVALCSFSKEDGAADIEKARRINSLLCNKILSDGEIKEYQNAYDRNMYLLEKWCIKESYLKLTGEGVYQRSMRYVDERCGSVYVNGKHAAYINDLRLYINSEEYIIKTASYIKSEISFRYLSSDEFMTCYLNGNYVKKI